MDDHTTDDRPRPTRRVGRPLVAVGVAVLVLAAVVWAVGVEEVHAVLGGVRPRDAAVLVGVGLLPILVWGVELRLVLRGIGEPVGTGRAVGLFAASGFLNNVTPLGELGGDPPSGLLIAGVCRTTFERGLAAITGLNAVNRVAVVAVGAAGVAWLGSDVRGVDAGLSPATAVGIWTALALLVVLAWVYRESVVERIEPPLAGAVVWIGRWLPLVDAPERSAVAARVDGFVDALERLAADPGRLLVVFLLGVAGHLAAATTLWVALWSLGVRIPAADVLVVIPLAKASGLSPTPGGAGSAVALLAGLLVALAGVDAATATGAALLYRAAAFWVPTALGGAIMVVLVGRAASP